MDQTHLNQDLVKTVRGSSGVDVSTKVPSTGREDFAKLLVTRRARSLGVLDLREVPTRGSGVQVPELTKFRDKTRESGGNSGERSREK